MPCLKHVGRRHLQGAVVVAAVFWINLFVLGFFRAGGVLYVALVETFRCSHELAAWPLSLAGATLCMIGPVAGGISRVLSIRVIITIGIFLTFLSTTLCYLAEDVITVVLLIGILYGVGIGLICTLTPILVTQYFEKNRSMACGIAYSGSTVGSFIWPPFYEYLILEFGIRGCLLIYGALVLHAVLGCIALQPALDTHTFSGKSVTLASGDPLGSIESNSERLGDVDHNTHHHHGTYCLARKWSSRVSIPSVALEGENACGVSVSGLCMVSSESDRRFSRDGSLSQEPRQRRKHNSSTGSERSCSLLSATDRSISKKVMEDSESDDTASRCSESVRIFLNDIRVCANRYFIFVTVSAVAFFSAFVTFITVIPDYATDKGISRSEAVFLLCVFGISDLISKPIPGLLTYKSVTNNKNIFIAGGFISGLLMIVMPHLHSYISFVVMTLLYGLVTGGLVFMSPVLLTEYLGMEQAAVAFGMSNLFIGFASLARPLIIGYFKDTWHSYNGLFYTMAVACILASLLWFTDPILNKGRSVTQQERKHSKHCVL